MITLLSALIGTGLTLPRMEYFSTLFAQHQFLGIAIGVLFSGLLGILVIRILMALTYWGIGKLFKGKATKRQVQLVVAYSLIPYLIYPVIGLIMIIPALITHNTELVLVRHTFTYLVVYLLSLRNLLYGLAYFNKFSYGYALLTVLIPPGILALIQMVLTNMKA